MDGDRVLAAAVLGSFGSFYYLGTRIDALGARWMPVSTPKALSSALASTPRC